MSHQKVKPLGEHQAAATIEVGDNPASCYHYTPQRELCQILDLADYALAQANIFREMWLSTGDGLAWRRWQACIADRRALLAEVG